MSKLNRILWAGLVLGVAACGDDVTVTNPPEPTPGIRSVTVSPSPVTVEVGKTVQMAASITLDPGATGTPSIAWSTSAAAVATVGAGNGLVTAVAPGSAAITATVTLGTSVAQGAATVNVVAAATCSISGVSVSPSSADLVIGQTLAVAANVAGSNCTAAQLGVTYSTSSATVATVNSTTGLVTAVGAGSATITATSVTDASKKAAMSVSVVPPTPATVTIESITQGALNIPVNLANVGGQVEVTLNIDPGSAPSVTKAQVLIGGTVVAEQTYGSASAGAESSPALAVSSVVLSTNTRQVRKASNNYVPVVFNGPSAFTARIYVAGSTTPAVSNAIPVVMQNKDGLVQGNLGTAAATPSPSFAVAGNTFYTGNVTYGGGSYVAFFPVTPTKIVFGSSLCPDAGTAPVGSPAGGLTFAGTLNCSGVEGATALTGATTVTAGTAPAADVIYLGNNGWEVVGTKYVVNGDDRWNLLSGSFTAPANVYVDNKAPTITPNPIGFLSGGIAGGDPAPNNCEETGITPGCWVGSSYNLFNDFGGSDLGTGVNSAATALFVWDNAATVPYCTTTAFSIASATEVAAPNTYDVCAVMQDNLGNKSNSRGFNLFGVDKTNPTLAYVGTYAVSTVNPAEVNVLPAAPGDTINFSLTDNNSGVAATVGLTVTFTRVLNNGGTVSTTACTNPVNTLTGSGTTPQFMATPYAIGSCTLPGERTWSAVGRDRAGNSAGPISRQLEYNPAAPAIAAVNIVPNYAAAANLAVDVLATDDEDLKSAEMWLHTTTNVGNHIRIVFGPRAGFFANLWGSDWDGQLKLFNTLGIDSRLTLPAAYSLAGYVESVANFAAGQAPIDTISNIVYDTYGTPSAGWVTALNPAFVNAASYSPAGAHPWAGGLGNVIGATFAGVGTQCTFEYTTPTNNPEVFTRIWVVNEVAPNFTVLTDLNSQPVLVSDNGIQRLYRYTLSNSATCANYGGTGVAANNIFAIKSNVAAIIF